MNFPENAFVDSFGDKIFLQWAAGASEVLFRYNAIKKLLSTCDLIVY